MHLLVANLFFDMLNVDNKTIFFDHFFSKYLEVSTNYGSDVICQKILSEMSFVRNVICQKCHLSENQSFIKSGISSK